MVTPPGIPNSVKIIDNCAFFGCETLQRVSIPNSVTRIGEGAFHDCNSLTSITIPDSVTSIGDGVFANCEKLVNVEGSKAKDLLLAVRNTPVGESLGICSHCGAHGFNLLGKCKKCGKRKKYI